MGLDVSVVKGGYYKFEPKDWDHEGLIGRDLCNIKDFPYQLTKEEEGFMVWNWKTENLFRVPSISYSTYGNWRECLCKYIIGRSLQDAWDQARTAKEEHEPYPSDGYLIVDFSDCEGTIGPTAARKLYDFFSAGAAKLDSLPDHLQFDGGQYRDSGTMPKSYFVGRYNQFMEAFKIASENHAYVIYA